VTISMSAAPPVAPGPGEPDARARRLIALYDRSPVGLPEIDAERRFTAVNEAFCRIVGRSREDLLGGLSFQEVAHPEYLAEISERVARCAETGEPFAVEMRLLRPDGATVWASVSAAAVAGLDGGPRSMAAAVIDVTARREAEERQAFLLKLSDALRAETGAEAVAERAIAMLRERIGVDLCYTAAYRPDDDRADITHQCGNDRAPSMPRSVRLSDFSAAYRVVLGQTLIVDDVVGDPNLSPPDRENMRRLGFGAMVAATLREGPERPLWVMVAVSAEPRRWTPGEVALVEEVAERTWAAIERARPQRPRARRSSASSARASSSPTPPARSASSTTPPSGCTGSSCWASRQTTTRRATACSPRRASRIRRWSCRWPAPCCAARR
jgi:PAS domain S-box-containing protein